MSVAAWRSKLTAAAAIVVLLSPAAPAAALSGHQHGHARLDVAVAAGELTIDFGSPLHDLLGFERAPRTDAERRAVGAMAARLRAADRLFVIDPAAGCALAEVVLVAPVVGLRDGAADAPTSGSTPDHADLEGRFGFRCDGPPPTWVDVALFGAFRRLSQIEVQAVGPRAQRRATLRRAGDAPVRLALPR